MRYAIRLLLVTPVAAIAAESSAQSTTGLDWELILKALGFVATVVITYVQIRSLNLTSRTTLKTDLEILKLLKPSDSTYQTLKQSIDARIIRLYTAPPPGTSRYTGERIGFAVFGLLWTLGFSYWTFRLVQPGVTWWSLLTGYLALMGIVWTFIGITGKGIILSRERERERQA